MLNLVHPMNFISHINNNALFNSVKSSAAELNSPVYLVGGYVRDLLLDKASKDIDFVTVGSGIELAKLLAKKKEFHGKLSVFNNFGTAMLRSQNMEIEFVGARKESYDRNSRKPIVEEGTLEEDLSRRDFTINAMAISLNPADYGDLIDMFGGLDDLKKKILKTPKDPQLTFDDDPLRMMRAIRFASQLNFDIEATTFESIINNKDRIKIVSAERVIDELNKIILSHNPSYGFKLLHHSGLLKIIFPEMEDLHGVETIDGKSHKDNFFHTLTVLENVCNRSDDLWLRWSAILHDIAKPATKRFNEKVGWTFHGHEDLGSRMVPRIFKRLRLPLNDHMKFVQKMVRLHLRPIALVKSEITDSAIRRLLYEVGDDIDQLMVLCRADITSKNHDRVKKYLANFDKVEDKMKKVEEKDEIRNFQPPISGEEIMNIFKLKPSKKVGIIKDEIKEAILDGKIHNNKKEAMGIMYNIAERLGINKKEIIDK